MSEYHAKHERPLRLEVGLRVLTMLLRDGQYLNKPPPPGAEDIAVRAFAIGDAFIREYRKKDPNRKDAGGESRRVDGPEWCEEHQWWGRCMYCAERAQRLADGWVPCEQHPEVLINPTHNTGCGKCLLKARDEGR
jgi:hypothetical protein